MLDSHFKAFVVSPVWIPIFTWSVYTDVKYMAHVLLCPQVNKAHPVEFRQCIDVIWMVSKKKPTFISKLWIGYGNECSGVIQTEKLGYLLKYCTPTKVRQNGSKSYVHRFEWGKIYNSKIH